MAYAQVNGVSLYYDEFGSGDKVIITASGGDFKHPDMNRWPFYMANYGYHLYTVTLRGHWKSTHITQDYGTEWYNIWADDIYEFGKYVGAEKYIYMGLFPWERCGLASGRPSSGSAERFCGHCVRPPIILTAT